MTAWPIGTRMNRPENDDPGIVDRIELPSSPIDAEAQVLACYGLNLLTCYPDRGGGTLMAESRKLAAIVAADVVGYSRLTRADEDRTLARLRALRSDLIDPTIALHHRRIVKRTGDGLIIEFRSVVDAVRCAIDVQTGMVERNAGVPPERRIEFRVGIHLGDVVEESDGDLMGDGVNIAARLQTIAKPGAICLSEQAYWQVKSRLDLKVSDLGATQLKNIAEPVHVYSLEVGQPTEAKPVPSAAPASKRHWVSAPLAAAFAAFILLSAGSGWFLLRTQRKNGGTRASFDGRAAVCESLRRPSVSRRRKPGHDHNRCGRQLCDAGRQGACEHHRRAGRPDIRQCNAGDHQSGPATAN